jgi:hypothetical protein
MLRVSVDASDVERRIVSVTETLTSPPEDLVLYYRNGSPASTRRVVRSIASAGLVIHAGDQTLRWKRDPLDANAFHIRRYRLGPMQSISGSIICLPRVIGSRSLK